MRLFRPIISLVLVLVTTLSVRYSSLTQVKIPTVYTPKKIAQLQPYRETIALAREDMTTLKEFITAENGVDTRTFIYRSLSGLRQEIGVASKKLLLQNFFNFLNIN
jgi:hypothetical protein